MTALDATATAGAQERARAFVDEVLIPREVDPEQLDRAEIHPLPNTRVPRAVEDIVAALARLPFALIELNPVIVHRDGAIAVDALVLEEDP